MPERETAYQQMVAFVRESNRIEGIVRDPTSEEVDAHYALIGCEALTVPALEQFVAIIQPSAVLRNHASLNVRVGSYRPPQGGARLMARLHALIDAINAKELTPFAAHVQYEQLHPFTDGNGRSGRAIWLWMMGGAERAPLGFLHHFYYQTLQAKQRGATDA